MNERESHDKNGACNNECATARTTFLTHALTSLSKRRICAFHAKVEEALK